MICLHSGWNGIGWHPLSEFESNLCLTPGLVLLFNKLGWLSWVCYGPFYLCSLQTSCSCDKETPTLLFCHKGEMSVGPFKNVIFLPLLPNPSDPPLAVFEALNIG